LAGGNGQSVGDGTVAYIGESEHLHRVRSVSQQIGDGRQLAVVYGVNGPQRRRQVRCQSIIDLVALYTKPHKPLRQPMKHYENVKAKSILSHKTYMAALIFVSIALSQTPVYTARPQIRAGLVRRAVYRCACLRTLLTYRWYSLRLPTEEWPG